MKDTYYSDPDKLSIGDRIEIAAAAIYFFLIHPLLKPVRALAIGWGYVLRGEKVETPYKWSDI